MKDQKVKVNTIKFINSGGLEMLYRIMYGVKCINYSIHNEVQELSEEEVINIEKKWFGS